MRSSSSFDLPKQLRFQIIGIQIHFAFGNFFIGGALKTKFANAQAIFRTNRWSKDATSHGTRFIKFTKSGRRIERRAGLIVGELRKALFRLFALVQQSAHRITREIFRQPGNRFPRPFAHTFSTRRCALVQACESFSKPDGVELIDRKDSDATLRAPWTTD